MYNEEMSLAEPKKYINQMNEEAPPRSGAIPELTSRAHSIADNLGEVVTGVGYALDRAFGPQPEKGAASVTPKAVANGTLDELKEALERIERLTDRLQNDYGPRLSSLT